MSGNDIGFSILGVPNYSLASAFSSSQIDHLWSAGIGVAPTSYQLDRSPNGSTGWANVFTGLATSFSDTGLSANTQYFYRLRALNGAAATGYVTQNATTQAAGTTTYTFNNGFESYALGNIRPVLADANYGSGGANGNGFTYITNAHAREGAQSCRFAITAEVAGDYRQELIPKDGLRGLPINSINDYWLGLSIYVPPISGTNQAIYQGVALQWHTNDTPQTGHSPSIGIRVNVAGGVLYWSMTRELENPVPPPNPINLGNINLGEWTDFVFRVRHRYDNTGLIQLWMNEDVNPRVDMANIQTIAAAFNPGDPVIQTMVPYFKFGIYVGSGGTTVSERFYDAIRFSTNGTRASMKPLGNRLAAT